jgi:hypothetical protein
VGTQQVKGVGQKAGVIIVRGKGVADDGDAQREVGGRVAGVREHRGERERDEGQ